MGDGAMEGQLHPAANPSRAQQDIRLPFPQSVAGFHIHVVSHSVRNLTKFVSLPTGDQCLTISAAPSVDVAMGQSAHATSNVDAFHTANQAVDGSSSSYWAADPADEEKTFWISFPPSRPSGREVLQLPVWWDLPAGWRHWTSTGNILRTHFNWSWRMMAFTGTLLTLSAVARWKYWGEAENLDLIFNSTCEGLLLAYASQRSKNRMLTKAFFGELLPLSEKHAAADNHQLVGSQVAHSSDFSLHDCIRLGCTGHQQLRQHVASHTFTDPIERPRSDWHETSGEWVRQAGFSNCQSFSEIF